MHTYWITVLLTLIAISGAAVYMVYKRKERFVETRFYGYSGAVGDMRSMKQQNFGIDDSIRGVFSARITTPKETYTKLFIRDYDNPYQERNLRLAARAKCKLVCAN